MKKVSSYQKLKEKSEKEITELRRQLMVLSTKPESSEATQIRLKWKLQANIESALMYGDSEIEEVSFAGILTQISSDNTYTAFVNIPITTITPQSK